MTRRRPDPELERRLRDWLHDSDMDDAAWQSPVDRAVASTEKLAQRRRPWSSWSRSGALLRAGGAAVAVVAAIVLAFVLTGPPRTDVGSSPPPQSVTPIPADTVIERTVASFTGPPGTPVGAGLDRGALWVVTIDGTVRRFDIDTGDELSRAQLPGNGCGPIVIGAGHAWTRACLSGPTQGTTLTWLVQLDLDDGSVVRSIRFELPIGFAPAFLDDAVWIIADQRGGELATVDPASGAVEPRFSMGGQASHLVVAADHLWVSLPVEGAVARVSPVTGDRADVAVGGRPGVLAFAAGRIWVGSGNDRFLDGIAPHELEVEVTIGLGDALAQLAVWEGELWALTTTRIERVDPAAAAVVDAIRVGTHSVSAGPQFVGPTYGMAIGEDVWYVPPGGEIRRLRR